MNIKIVSVDVEIFGYDNYSTQFMHFNLLTFNEFSRLRNNINYKSFYIDVEIV